MPPPAMTRVPALTAKGLRILIVDDNRDAAEMLAMLLQFSGHETHLAHDGVEAVEATTKLQPDVILLDIGLPRLNGYEAARKIVNNKNTQAIVTLPTNVLSGQPVRII